MERRKGGGVESGEKERGERKEGRKETDRKRKGAPIERGSTESWQKDAVKEDTTLIVCLVPTPSWICLFVWFG